MEGRSFLSRPRMRSRAATKTGSTLLELETLSNYSALEARAVTLSADEALVVSRLAELLLSDTLRTYEDYLLAGGRADPRGWKLVKRKDQLAVYKQRREAAPQAPRWASASSSATDMTGDLAATVQRETALPMLLVSGTLPSGTTLDDAMFGLASASTREFKLASAYAEESAVVDAAVLTALEQPTIDDPFRFLGLKWMARRHGGSLKKRDLLFLEATGVARLPAGDRVGYRVMHSVSVRALAQLGAVAVADSVVRAKSSVVQLFHEVTPSANGNAFVHAPVRVFARGYYDPMGGMMHFVALNVAAELLLTLAHGPGDCAHLKKIAKAAQRAQRDRTRRRRRSTATAMAAGMSPGVRKPSRFPTNNRYHQDSSMQGIVEVDEAMVATNADVVLYPPTYSAHDGDHDISDVPMDEDEPVLELSPSLCHVCECSLGGVFDRSAAPCTICFHMICSRCSVTKKLRFSWTDESARGLAHALVDSSGVDTSGGGITASSTSQSQGSTERSRSRSRSGSGTSHSLLSALHHSQMADVAAKPLNFCLPCVVAANQQSGAQLAVDDMMSGSGSVAVLRTRTASYMDGMTPKSSTTPMGRATTASLGYNANRLSVSSTASGASASTTPRQRWTRGSSIYGARPTYDLLDYYNTGSSSRKSMSQSQLPPPHRPSGSQYFPQTQPQHQYRIYGKDNGGSQDPSARQSQRQKAFSLAAPTPRDSAPKVVLFDMEDYARRASRV